MAVSFIAALTATHPTLSTFEFGLPAVVVGDLLIAIIGHQQAAADNATSGWGVAFEHVGGTDGDHVLGLMRFVDGSEAADITLILDRDITASGICAVLVYRGVDSSLSAFDIASVAVGGLSPSTDFACPSRRVAAGDAYVGIARVVDTSDPVLTLPGNTRIIYDDGGTASQQIGVFDLLATVQATLRIQRATTSLAQAGSALSFVLPGAADQLTTIDFPVPDHAEEMVARLPGQFRPVTDDPNNITKLLTALATPVQDFESAGAQSLTRRSINTGAGAQLDVIGTIVDEPRNGLTDSLYRRRLAARIAAHRSRGLVEDLITITKLVVSNVRAVVQVVSSEVATVVVRVTNATVSDDLADAILFKFLKDAVACGVRVVLESGSTSFPGLFRFDLGPGFDDGHFADARG